jgi:hypothetical protein
MENLKDGETMFCMLLTSTYLFLRHDECHNIKVEDIRPKYSADEQMKIVNLCFRIQGKTDKTPQNLILWAYDDCPALCPIRHLMSYNPPMRNKRWVLVPQLEQPVGATFV